jgi:hypothetical protein
MPARPAKDAVMPIKTLATAALAVAVVAPPTLATAAPAKAKPAAVASADDGDADSAARRSEGDKTYYDFVEGDRAEGIVLKPTGEHIGAHGHIKFGSLITIRSHFMPELVRTARDL